MATFLLISIGAIVGGFTRWVMGLWLNPLFGSLAFGTLLINWLGCFLIGLTMGISLSEQTKLCFVTGFLGCFTTFSAFSAEVSKNLLESKWLTAFAIFGLHTLGGFACTLFAVYLMKK